MAKTDDIRRMLGSFEAFDPRVVRKDDAAPGEPYAIGKLVAFPEPVEKGSTPSGHHDAHISERPVCGIARRQADTIPLGDALLRDEPTGDPQRRAIGFAESEAHIAIDEEGRVLVLVAVMGEVMRQARRGVLEGRHRNATALERDRFENLPRRGQSVGDPVHELVEFCTHRSGNSSPNNRAARNFVAFVATRRNKGFFPRRPMQ